MSDTMSEFVDIHHPETGDEGRVHPTAVQHLTEKGWVLGKAPTPAPATPAARGIPTPTEP